MLSAAALWPAALPAQSQGSAAEAALLGEMPVVEAAALHSQSLEEAPASVSVISRAEIRRYGYRTLADALDNARGFFMTSDSVGWFAGVRGFSLPGDYNSRVLVMINGHPLTDTVYNAMYRFGQDFGLDLDLVERIEVIRGPSSALYGSNGVFATINIVTRSPAAHERARATVESAGFGTRKVQLSGAMYLGGGANLLLAASAQRSAGREVYSPDLDRSTGRVGAEKGYHTFANLLWRNWNFTALFGEWSAEAPFGWYQAVFGDRATRTSDYRNYAEAVWTKAVGASSEVRWRMSYDTVDYHAWYRYPGTEEGLFEDQRDLAEGRWLGTRFSWRLRTRRWGTLTAGAEATHDLRNYQENYLLKPDYEPTLAVDARDSSWGAFAQHELPLARTLTLYTGVRWDDARRHAPFLSPRVAAVWRPARGSAVKLMLGRAFRNPSSYEAYYSDGGMYYVANPALKPETTVTYEAALEHAIHRRAELVAAFYRYGLSGLIQEVELPEGATQYWNASRTHAHGLELEFRGRPAGELEVAAAAAVQRSIDPSAGERLPNSPRSLVQFRSSLPLAAGRIWLTSSTRYVAARSGAGGDRIAGYAVVDATATTERLHRSFDVQFGIRNLLDRRYADPLSAEHAPRVIPRAGRTAFVKLIWKRTE